MKLGTYFPQNGIYKLSDGTFCAVEGHDVLGCRNEVFLVNSLVALFQVVRAGATAIIAIQKNINSSHHYKTSRYNRTLLFEKTLWILQLEEHR